MLVFSVFCWILKRAFWCHHLRTTVNEGKCYCPDCGRGLIYHWVVLRCVGCQARLESKASLGQVTPLHRCCPHCGENQTRMDRLELPAYFHLHKAQLMVQEEADYIQFRFGGSLRSMGDIFRGDIFRGHIFRQTAYNTMALLNDSPPVKQLACLSNVGEG